MLDIDKTKHYTTKAEEICSNLVSFIPQNVQLIEPFVGNGDLLPLFPNFQWELYDLDDKGNNIIQDTLKNPPIYKNKWVITNPPYLAKNKAQDKSIFNQYDTDDLYKATLLSIMECSGGILIIPTNFFTDEKTGTIRKKFLNQFEILAINIFTTPVFISTTYSVCSFAFKRKEENKEESQNLKINIYPLEKEVSITIYPEYDYRIAGEFYSSLNNTDIIFERLIGASSSKYITNIKLYAIDTRNEKIRVEFEPNHYEGKNSDRTYATFVCQKTLNETQEKFLIKEFNKQLTDFRNKYYDLSMTNYRDYNRKRISFTFAYQLLSKIYFDNYT